MLKGYLAVCSGKIIEWETLPDDKKKFEEFRENWEKDHLGDAVNPE